MMYTRRNAAYRRNRVREYLVWLVEEQRVEWWEWREEEYVPLPLEEGLVKSHVFPGLWLEVEALLAGQSARLLEQRQRGIDTPEHQHFVAHLKSKLSF